MGDFKLLKTKKISGIKIFNDSIKNQTSSFFLEVRDFRNLRQNGIKLGTLHAPKVC